MQSNGKGRVLPFLRLLLPGKQRDLQLFVKAFGKQPAPARHYRMELRQNFRQQEGPARRTARFLLGRTLLRDTTRKACALACVEDRQAAP